MDEKRQGELARWFEEASKEVSLRKVVPPPPPGQPVLAIKAWYAPCKWCAERVRQTGVPYPDCTHCKGKGFIIVTGG